MFLKKLDKPLLEALEEAKLEKATSFQKKCIAQIKSGADLIAVAPAGAGKSTTIAIALIQKLKREIDDVPRAIVFVENSEKTDELAAIFETLAVHTSLRIRTVYEKGRLDEQRDSVYFGADVVIGSPLALGRIYSNNGLNLNELKIVVVDEAVFVFKDKNIPQIDRLTETTPKAQHIIFSDRPTNKTDRYANEYMNFPKVIQAEDEEV